ncbi:unnamed protein product [Ixodes persulcatus]
MISSVRSATILRDNFSWHFRGEEESSRTALCSAQIGRGNACLYLPLHCPETLSRSIALLNQGMTETQAWSCSRRLWRRGGEVLGSQRGIWRCLHSLRARSLSTPQPQERSCWVKG